MDILYLCDRILKGAVNGAIDGAKKLLGIKSPYKKVIDRIRNDLKQQIEEVKNGES